jgi:hypothetical protein
MDDDVYRADKTERMMNFFLTSKEITLVTSSRQPIDQNGDPLQMNGAVRRLFDRDVIMDGSQFLSQYVAESLENVIGEPTTPIFRLRDVKGKLGVIKGRQYRVVTDLVTWVNILQQGKIAYVSEALSYFRIHGQQDQNRLATVLRGSAELFFLFKEFGEMNLWSAERHANSLKRIQSIFQHAITRAKDELSHHDSEQIEAWRVFQGCCQELISR